MSHEIVLLETSSGSEQQIAHLVEGEYEIGREPESGITVDNQAVSRVHGLFKRVRNHWLFKDLGSTNGSWLNSQPLRHHQWYLARPGDYLQLADVALILRALPTPGAVNPNVTPTGRSLLVFRESSNFLDEFPVPEYGKALVLGGSQADFEINGDTSDTPALVIEKKGNDVVAYSVSGAVEVQSNAIPQRGEFVLSDGDFVTAKEYGILFNDPVETKTSEGKGWESGSESTSEKRNRLADFGSFDDDFSDTDTVSIDSRELEGTIGHPASRRYYEMEGSYSSSEDKIILVVGLLLVLALIILAAYLLF